MRAIVARMLLERHLAGCRQCKTSHPCKVGVALTDRFHDLTRAESPS